MSLSAKVKHLKEEILYLIVYNNNKYGNTNKQGCQATNTEEKKTKYKILFIKIQKMWNVNCVTIPVTI
jgi:hypothetical protein